MAEDAGASVEGRARIVQEAAAQAESVLGRSAGGALGDVLAGGAVTGKRSRARAPRESFGGWGRHQGRCRGLANSHWRGERSALGLGSLKKGKGKQPRKAGS